MLVFMFSLSKTHIGAGMFTVPQAFSALCFSCISPSASRQFDVEVTFFCVFLNSGNNL